jgi:hypothetical protein
MRFVYCNAPTGILCFQQKRNVCQTSRFYLTVTPLVASEVASMQRRESGGVFRSAGTSSILPSPRGLDDGDTDANPKLRAMKTELEARQTTIQGLNRNLKNMSAITAQTRQELTAMAAERDAAKAEVGVLRLQLQRASEQLNLARAPPPPTPPDPSGAAAALAQERALAQALASVQQAQAQAKRAKEDAVAVRCEMDMMAVHSRRVAAENKALLKQLATSGQDAHQLQLLEAAHEQVKSAHGAQGRLLQDVQRELEAAKHGWAKAKGSLKANASGLTDRLRSVAEQVSAEQGKAKDLEGQLLDWQERAQKAQLAEQVQRRRADEAEGGRAETLGELERAVAEEAQAAEAALAAEEALSLELEEQRLRADGLETDLMHAGLKREADLEGARRAQRRAEEALANLSGSADATVEALARARAGHDDALKILIDEADAFKLSLQAAQAQLVEEQALSKALQLQLQLAAEGAGSEGSEGAEGAAAAAAAVAAAAAAAAAAATAAAAKVKAEEEEEQREQTAATAAKALQQATERAGAAEAAEAAMRARLGEEQVAAAAAEAAAAAAAAAATAPVEQLKQLQEQLVVAEREALLLAQARGRIRDTEAELQRTVQQLVVTEEASESHFTCMVCLQLFTAPTTCAPCGHTFCSECVAATAESAKDGKPFCRECGEGKPCDYFLENELIDQLAGKFNFRMQALHALKQATQAVHDSAG